MITLNDRARHLTWIKTSQISRSVLTYQKMLARIFNVLVENLNKTLAVQSKLCIYLFTIQAWSKVYILHTYTHTVLHLTIEKFEIIGVNIGNSHNAMYRIIKIIRSTVKRMAKGTEVL